MSAAAIVVAAGRGERLGGPLAKALVPVAGRPLVVHAVERLGAAGIDRIVVVHPRGAGDTFAAALADHPQVTFAVGGAERSHSVRAGLDALPDDVGRVAVHDAARGLQPASVITATVAAVTGPVVAAAPALPVTDTLKRVAGEEIVATVARDELVSVQTPQVADAALLRAAHATGTDATDDLALVEAHLRSGGAEGVGRIVHVPGSPLGRKVTYAADVTIVEALLAAR